MQIVREIVSYMQDLSLGFLCLIIFVFPAILAWIASLLGFSVPIENEAILGFVLYWAATEFLLFYLIAMNIRNIEKIGVRLLAGTIVSAFVSAGAMLLGAGLPGLYEHERYDEIKKADHKRFHCARIALFSGLLALVLTFIVIVLILMAFVVSAL